MTNIIIEAVKNGWMVTPAINRVNQSVGYVVEEVSVYTNIEELQKALPDLLGANPKINIVHEK